MTLTAAASPSTAPQDSEYLGAPAVESAIPDPSPKQVPSLDLSFPVLELDHLSVKLGRNLVLRELVARVTGKVIGLLGPNGAGKTTLLHTVLGFHKVSSGRAAVLGRDVAREGRAARALMGYMPEKEAYVAGMTGIRFVKLMGEISGLPASVALERAHEMLYLCGLGEARYREISSYSTGMKQSVKLAQALVHGPRLLLLDEPTNGLDPMARKRMLDLVRAIRDRDETRIILSSHLLKDVEDCCDQVLILKQGRIVNHCDLEAEREANRSFIQLEVRGDAEGFSSDLDALGCTWARTGANHFKLVLKEGQNTEQIYRLAHARRLQLRKLDFRRESLQDIFLKAMENGNGGL